MKNCYKCHPDIAWVVDKDGLIFFHQKTKTRHRMNYPEAAFWDLLSREMPYESITNMMASLLGKDRRSTQLWMSDVIEVWRQKDFIVAEDDNG
jgi:hypothetical protein